VREANTAQGQCKRVSSDWDNHSRISSLKKRLMANVELLSTNAEGDSQEAHSAFTNGTCSKWIHFQMNSY